MNKKQTITMWVGIAIFVLLGIFPPWIATNNLGGLDFVGYTFIFIPAGKETIYENHTKIDFTRLLTQWTIVSVITVGLIVTFKDQKPKDE